MRRGELDDTRAQRLHDLGPGAVALALLPDGRSQHERLDIYLLDEAGELVGAEDWAPAEETAGQADTMSTLRYDVSVRGSNLHAAKGHGDRRCD